MAYYPGNQQPQGQQNPVDLVKMYRAQGMDNNQIIQSLQAQNFPWEVIFKSMNQLDMPPEPESNVSFSYSQPSSEAPKQRNVPAGDSTSSEELIEAIVEEKWNALVNDLNKIVEWKNQTTTRIAVIEQKIDDTRREIEKLQGAIIAKIDDYDKNISNVGAEVKAMEKVFSKVLPVFAENVSELSRIAKDLKTPPVMKSK